MLSWQTLLVLAACAIPAVAGAAVCDAYTPETPCIALEGVCYNAGTCQCETHLQKAECLVDPCSVNKCADGYKCRSSRCGGCHHQCDKIEATPAPAPTPAPRVCNAYTPETPCIALEGVCYNAGTCQCETHFQKAECLVDPCSVNKCADGYKCRSSRCGGCHHQCDKIEATPAPAPTPAPRVCNAYTPETPCIAQEGVCYNSGTCQCGFHPRVQCWINPCWWSPCGSGYECRPTNCGECGHQCSRV